VFIIIFTDSNYFSYLIVYQSIEQRFLNAIKFPIDNLAGKGKEACLLMQRVKFA
jgi:hypothetical protein